ncbi:MAG: MBOAT family O-acyltransferase [Alphaproteobacteria bacterium]
MNWLTAGFALFVAVVWLFFMLLPARLRGYWLLLASLCFFATEGLASLALVAGMIAWTWLQGRVIYRAERRKGTVALGVAGLLLVLAAGKYLNWILGLSKPLTVTLGLSGLQVPEWLGPLGMSYFVFRLISYLADIALGRIEPACPWRLTGYVLFFPTLPAGPIERFGDFDPQAAAGERPRFDDLRAGFLRIAVGLFKKVVLSEILLEFSGIMRSPAGVPVGWLWLGMYAYTLYIYIDFSGYCDIAIGIARCFNLRIRENFAWPYLRTNIAEFWRHWHMSLTAFITEYIYFPLGGNRRGQVRAGVNTLIAMGLCGLWHGAGWHFLIWGLYHGAGLIVFRTWRKLRQAKGWHRPESIPRRLLAWAVTFQFVALGWVVFLLPFREAVSYYLALFGLGR